MGSRGSFVGVPGIVNSRAPGIPIYQEPITEMRTIVSASLWCDIDDPETNYKGQIGHPMSSKDPDYQHFTKTQQVQVPTGNSYGAPTYQRREEVTEELDICGYHWRKQNPFLQNPAEKALPKDQSQQTLDDLQKMNDDWQAGYDAATEHYLTRAG
jgi:hypothetical protein